MLTVSVERVVAAPVGDVFEWLSDASNYTRSRFVLRERLVRRGEDAAYGLGAVRQLTWLFGWFRERITAYRPPHEFHYLVERSLPLTASRRRPAHVHPGPRRHPRPLDHDRRTAPADRRGDGHPPARPAHHRLHVRQGPRRSGRRAGPRDPRPRIRRLIRVRICRPSMAHRPGDLGSLGVTDATPYVVAGKHGVRRLRTVNAPR
jgi:hypothetical protein